MQLFDSVITWFWYGQWGLVFVLPFVLVPVAVWELRRLERRWGKKGWKWRMETLMPVLPFAFIAEVAIILVLLRVNA